MTPSRCKGFFYSNGNALNFKCHRCGIGKQFHTFLEDHFPSVFLEYVAERDGLGLTGKGTNAPTLSNATERVSGQVTAASGDEVVESGSDMKKTGYKSAGNDAASNQNRVDSGARKPTITKLPRLTPQQQAGCSARLAHKVKQHQQRRQQDPAARYLQE
jgi:hypothetical protein